MEASRLLKDLVTLKLSKDLQKINEWNNTIVFTYSEFGRTAKKNKRELIAVSSFSLGGKINGGLYGSIPPYKIIDGDLLYYGLSISI